MPPPADHGEPVAGEGGGWRRGTFIPENSRSEYAYTTDGVMKKLWTWNSRTGVRDFTVAGRNYYEHNRQRFIVNIPCKAYIPPDKR
ncbi:MAG: hypothetical protein EBZ36_16425, partial [Acidobacteria bacterium]|nr:hypothetical protein [Acidobacteriota bacterium]